MGSGCIGTRHCYLGTKCFGGNSCNLLHTTRRYMFEQAWIAQSVWRRAPRPGFDSQEEQDFSLLRSIQIASEAQPAPIQWVPGVKRPGLEAEHLPLSSSEVKSGGAILPLPHMSSWCSA
jgi:hypothetical protein